MCEGKLVYGRSRFPKLHKDENGKNLCRGCRGPITDPRRKTWCGPACTKKFHPLYVKLAVIERDKFICQMCGLDIKAAVKQWRSESVDWFKDKEGYKAWKKRNPKAEYDHIVPFSEGGLTTLENMRTLCRCCHKKVTAEFANRRALQKKGGVCGA